MISARLLAVSIHSLLDNDPLAVIGHDEDMKIKVEAARRRCPPWRQAGSRRRALTPNPTPSPIVMSMGSTFFGNNLNQFR